jgi:hypothetical protein
MKQALSIAVLCLLPALAAPAYGDIARPQPSPFKPKIVLHTNLTIVPDNKAYEARLQISQSSMQELRAALANMPGNESVAQQITHSNTRTILAGIFMFLSLSFAGVWLARSAQTRSQKTLVVLLLGTGVMGAAAVMTRANAGPPSSFYWRKLSQNLSKGASTSGGVNIEVVPDSNDGRELTLINPTRPD